MKERPLYFISEYAEDYFFHGGIGIIDAERILEQQGFQPIRLPFHFSFSLWAKLSRLWYCVKLIFSIERNAAVVFIHPLHARLNNWLVSFLNRRKVMIICMIGDIDGLKDGDRKLLEHEIKLLSRFQYFIVHNQGMLDWLNAYIPGRKAELIEFFDFLTSPASRQLLVEREIVFAGNLDKSKFLLDLQRLPLHFNLYGPGINLQMQDQSNVTYHGIFDPYELPGKLHGSFGLVWDGESVDEMKGSLGDYMQYISHHKLSLYILAGLPVITACSSGASALVKKYRIGFCVDSLSEISDRMNKLTRVQYQEMVDNMQPLANRIANGNCLSAALERLMLRLN
ncbi:MAG TPA: hypothetical protein VEV87_08310 [Chitinophagaceae bacterium]|nr:hypothetical protein [Chitinophagaceae bacterium]